MTSLGIAQKIKRLASFCQCPRSAWPLELWAEGLVKRLHTRRAQVCRWSATREWNDPYHAVILLDKYLPLVASLEGALFQVGTPKLYWWLLTETILILTLDWQKNLRGQQGKVCLSVPTTLHCWHSRGNNEFKYIFRLPWNLWRLFKQLIN